MYKARHAMATLCGLASTFDKVPEPRRAAFHAHLTLLGSYLCTRSRYDSPTRPAQPYERLDCENRDQGDTHVCPLRCRDAVVLLQQVLPISSLVAGVHSSGSSVRLQALLKDLQVQLSSPGPKLPSYAHVVSDTVPAILDVLDL